MFNIIAHRLSLRRKKNKKDRGHTSSPTTGDQPANKDPVLLQRTDTPGRTQDDTVVYETKQKDNATRRPKRRGASFNLRSTNANRAPWQQEETPATNPGYVGSRSSLSGVSGERDRGERDRVAGDVYSERLRGMKSSPSLQYYSQNDTPTDMDCSLPATVAPSQSWHSGLTAGDSTTPGTANTHGTYMEEPRGMKKSLSYTSAPGRGFGQYDNLGPVPFRRMYCDDMDNKENHPSRGSTEQDIGSNLSASYSGPSSSGSAPWHSRTSSHNYENLEAMEYPGQYGEMKVASKSDSHDSGIGTVDGYGDRTDSYRSDSYNRPLSPPQPPVRDASSINYKHGNNHEKYPSWPVTQATLGPVPHPDTDTTYQPGISSRTKSWSDTSHSNTEFPNKPRMAYQPHLNTHMEERVSPQVMKQYLEENRLKSPKEQFDERVATELKGEDLDIKKNFPLDKKGKIDISSLSGSDLCYPLPKVDKDGRYMEDKNYAIPSPPQRDRSPVRKLDKFAGAYAERYLYSTVDGYDNVKVGSPPPPLPENSPPYTGVMGDTGHPYSTHMDTHNTSQYPCIVRQPRAYYNTSTQTELKNTEVQAEPPVNKPTARLRRQEKSCQAREGSIVAHHEKHQKQLHNNTEGDYERLIFKREEEMHSVGIGTTSDIGTSPGPFSPRDHRMDHRIPETIQENEEGFSKRDVSKAPTFQEDVFAQIHGHTDMADTVMLRRLSQDFFKNQSGNMGRSAAVSAHQNHVRQNSDNDAVYASHNKLDSQSHLASQRRSLDEQSSHTRHGSGSGQYQVPARATPAQGAADPEAAEQEDKLEDLPKTPNSQFFDRNKSANMSLRKAYGIFDEISMGEKANKKLPQKSMSTSEMPGVKSKKKKVPTATLR